MYRKTSYELNSGLVNLSFFLCFRPRGPQAKEHSEEYRDRSGRRDAQSYGPAGEPRVHRGQHEQLWLRGKVSIINQCTFIVPTVRPNTPKCPWIGITVIQESQVSCSHFVDLGYTACVIALHSSRNRDAHPITQEKH